MDERLFRTPGARAARAELSPPHTMTTFESVPEDRPTRPDGWAANDRLMRHDPPASTLEGLVNRPDW